MEVVNGSMTFNDVINVLSNSDAPLKARRSAWATGVYADFDRDGIELPGGFLLDQDKIATDWELHPS